MPNLQFISDDERGFVHSLGRVLQATRRQTLRHHEGRGGCGLLTRPRLVLLVLCVPLSMRMCLFMCIPFLAARRLRNAEDGIQTSHQDMVGFYAVSVDRILNSHFCSLSETLILGSPMISSSRHLQSDPGEPLLGHCRDDDSQGSRTVARCRPRRSFSDSVFQLYGCVC